MKTSTEPVLTTVTSDDCIEIAVFVSGAGRPLVFLHGTSSDHLACRFVLPFLEPHCTVHAVDRRGRGASGDSPDYRLSMERADAAIVIDAAAEASGGPVDVFGHSYGGNVAFGAALLTTNIRKLVLYEGWPPPNPAQFQTAPATLEHLESLLAQGHREQMLEELFTTVVLVPEDELNEIKAATTWPARVAAAHTVPRELRAYGADAFDPEQAARIRVPVMLLVGSDSPPEGKMDPEIVAAALPNATIRVLEGQQHMALLTDPEQVACEVLAFLAE